MIFNLLNKSKYKYLPRASEVLKCYLLQENSPHWTAFFVRYKDVVNDQFALSCFLQRVNQSEYLVLRTGCFPYIKYHCSKIEPGSYGEKDLRLCNYFLNFIKVANLGIPTLAYGVGGMFLKRHSELVHTSKGDVRIYFWYKENRNSQY